MSKFSYLIKEGFRNLRVNRLMSFASVTVLFSCLMLVGIAFMALVNIQSFITGIEAENVIMAYVDEKAYDYELSYVEANLNKIDNIASVEKVERDSAYREILDGLDDSLRAYLESVDENPLPNAFKITVSDMSRFNEVVENVKGTENVMRVHENSELASQLSGIRNSLTYISVGIIALLLIVSLFIISNTIKVTMFSRRLEISIMKSVGATNSFIRLPFIVEGIIIGIIAGLLATGAVWGLYEFALGSFMSMFSSFGNMKPVEFIDYAPYLVAAFVGIGVFTGVFGSSASIRKYLKERKFVDLEDR